MFWKVKKDPERDLKKLVDELKTAGGNSLKSVIVFGSFASDEFHPTHSDINVLVVLISVTVSTLVLFQKALSTWARKGHPLPILVSSVELPALARSHPIEFIDMKDHHRVIVGEDVLTALEIDRHGVRFQIEHDLSQTLIKLRQRCAASGGKPAAIKNLLIESIPSTLTLLRAINGLQENASGLSKIEAAERLAPTIGIDPILLRRLANFRFERKSDDVKGLMDSYISLIEKVREFLGTSH